MDVNARDPGRVTAVLGPTNTGKTHFAIERMLSHRTGIIGLPCAFWRVRCMTASWPCEARPSWP